MTGAAVLAVCIEMPPSTEGDSLSAPDAMWHVHLAWAVVDSAGQIRALGKEINGSGTGSAWGLNQAVRAALTPLAQLAPPVTRVVYDYTPEDAIYAGFVGGLLAAHALHAGLPEPQWCRAWRVILPRGVRARAFAAPVVQAWTAARGEPTAPPSPIGAQAICLGLYGIRERG